MIVAWLSGYVINLTLFFWGCGTLIETAYPTGVPLLKLIVGVPY